LAAGYGVDYQVRQTFSSFDDFNSCYAEVLEFIRTPDDLGRIISEIVEDNATDGVRYIEPMMLPELYTDRFGLSVGDVFSFMRECFFDAGAHHNVEVGLIPVGIWAFDLDQTTRAAQFAVEHKADGVVAFGFCGVEPQTSYATWSRPCDIARDGGIGIVPHAGEFGGAANVSGAVDLLKADRISHGVRAVEDAHVLESLADTGVVCDVAPTSNVVLGVFPEMRSVPIDRFLEAGVRFTINDDDALFFGSRIGNEYEVVRDVFGLSDHELAEIARTSVDASFAPDAVKMRMSREIDAWLLE
jgi:adenosine deaminase